MKIKFAVFITSLLLLISCKQKAKQFEYNGGTFRMCLENGPITAHTYNIEDYYSATVYKQVMQGLTALDPKTLKVIPGLAKSWSINDDGTVYTFILRNDVVFHPHPSLDEEERKLTTEDVLQSFELICKLDSKGKNTVAYNVLFKNLLVGAEDFQSGKQKTISGLIAKNNSIQITLLHRDDNFLYKLASIHASIHNRKIIKEEKTNALVGTGPFILKGNPIKDQRIHLSKNENYYQKDENGNQLPYLDAIEFIIENKKLDQLELFENNEINIILGLPSSQITKIVEGRKEDFNSKPPLLVLNRQPMLESHYYFFNMHDPRFEDPRVRKAFNLAINRNKIGREILRNQFEELGNYGIIPPINNAFRGYDFDGVKNAGYDYDPLKAKKLLSEAGFPNGKNFGSVNLRYNIGEINSFVADEFAQQIRQVLGINVNIDGSSFEQLNLDAANGNGDIFRSAWSADYPNPDNFLHLFYSKNITDLSNNNQGVNNSKYSNPTFDQLLEDARKQENIGQKMKLYAKAERELLLNPPIIPLWYSGDMQIMYSSIRNLQFNSLNYFDFTTVYIKDWTEEEYQRELAKKNK